MAAATPPSILTWTLPAARVRLDQSTVEDHELITSPAFVIIKAIGRLWKFKLSDKDDWVRDGEAAAHEPGQDGMGRVG